MITSLTQKQWDWILMALTVGLLGSLGVQSFIGTLYVWWAVSTTPDFNVAGYQPFNVWMNAIAAPQVIALVLVMGLCVPKRLFERTTLIAVSASMIVAGILAGALTGSLQVGVTVYLALAALIQFAVVALTVTGIRGASYLTESRIIKTGSGLLHLGFILFAIVVVAMQRSPFMLPLFWTSTALLCTGSLIAFYADRLAWRKRIRVETNHSLAEE